MSAAIFRDMLPLCSVGTKYYGQTRALGAPDCPETWQSHVFCPTVAAGPLDFPWHVGSVRKLRSMQVPLVRLPFSDAIYGLSKKGSCDMQARSLWVNVLHFGCGDDKVGEPRYIPCYR
jgi:hypothetical protein